MAGYTKQSEDELKREIKEQFTFAKKYLDVVHQRMNDQEELYRTFINAQNYPHNARVFDPRTFRVIETITPRMVANEPTGTFYPQEMGDESTAHIFSALLKYDWRRADMFEKLVMSAKSMLIFGTFFGRTYWDNSSRTRTMMEPKKVGGRLIWVPTKIKKVVTEFDGPNYELLNIYDCFPDPNSTSLKNMRWFIYRTFKTFEELTRENDARGAEYWKNLDELKSAIADKKSKKAGGKPDDMQYREHRRVMLSSEDLTGQDESSAEFTVLIRYTADGWCYYIPEYDVIVREVENPYFHGELPLVYGVDYPYPGELYGMGEIEPIDRIQRAINAVLNQRLDNVQLTLNTMWKVKKNADVDMNTLFSAPGNIITMGDLNAVEPVVTPDVTGGTFVQTMNYLTGALQNGSGITDYTTGLNTGENTQNDTATGVRLIQQEANSQFKLKIQLFNHMIVEKIANHWKDLRIQFTTEEQLLRIVGKDQVEYLRDNTNLSQIDQEGNPIVPGDPTESKLQIGPKMEFAFLKLYPEDIQPSVVGDYDFVAKVSSDLVNDPIAMQENFFTAIDRLSQPQFVEGLAKQGKMLDYELAARTALDKLNSGVDGKEFITDLPQPAPQMGGMPTDQMDPMAQDPMASSSNPLEQMMNQSPESLTPQVPEGISA